MDQSEVDPVLPEWFEPAEDRKERMEAQESLREVGRQARGKALAAVVRFLKDAGIEHEKYDDDEEDPPDYAVYIPLKVGSLYVDQIVDYTRIHYNFSTRSTAMEFRAYSNQVGLIVATLKAWLSILGGHKFESAR